MPPIAVCLACAAVLTCIPLAGHTSEPGTHDA